LQYQTIIFHSPVFFVTISVEEVVDFEEYMADADNPDGRVYTFDSASLTADTIEFQNHPEVISFEVI
jgi:hypothetical protein